MKLAAFVLVVISAVMLLVTTLPADENKIALCLSHGMFTPVDSSTRDLYSDSLSRFAITTFQPEVPRKWRFTAETGSLKFGGVNADVKLIPITG